jgi:hypothetical protein
MLSESGTMMEPGAEQLEDTIPRLRILEKSLALADGDGCVSTSHLLMFP